jgi:hypothetical protein
MLVIGAPLAALAVIDVRLGIAGLAGAIAGLTIGRSIASRPSDTAPIPPEAALSPRARDQIREIEIERLEGKVAEMERLLEEERSARSELLAIFDSTDDTDPAIALRQIRTRLRIRQQAAAPAEPLPLGDVLVGCVGNQGWRPGDITITDALPTVMAPADLICSVIRALFRAWAAIPPIMVGGRLDGGMALVRFDGLGIRPEPESEHFQDARFALEQIGGALIPHSTGLTVAIPLVVRQT